MFPRMKKLNYIGIACFVFLLTGIHPVFAAGPPIPSSMDNTMAIFLVVLAFLLLICISILANVLLYTAKAKIEKEKINKEGLKIIPLVLFLLLANEMSARAGDLETATAPVTGSAIAGMSSFAFYMIMSVIFLELLVILVMLFYVKSFLKEEKMVLAKEVSPVTIKKPSINWWTKLNRFKPVEQEADIDLGHNYDGIRELDNRLPPWWIYGFYLTIIIACIYLYRFHVSHTGATNIEEYQASVIKADNDIKDYLVKKGDAVDENTVVLLTSPDDIASGKTIFTITCVACHKATGGGDVGPNLTDDYWLHGGGIKNIFKTIRYGSGAMPQWQNSYSNKQIAQLASYVKSLKGTNPPNPKAPQGDLYKEEPVINKLSADSTGKQNKTVTSASMNR